MFRMINKPAPIVELWCTLISRNFYFFQNNFASIRGPKWILFRLKRFLLEALSATTIRTRRMEDKSSRIRFYKPVVLEVVDFDPQGSIGPSKRSINSPRLEWGSLNGPYVLSIFSDCVLFYHAFQVKRIHIYFDTYFPCISNCWARPRRLQKIVYRKKIVYVSCIRVVQWKLENLITTERAFNYDWKGMGVRKGANDHSPLSFGNWDQAP